MSIPTLQGLQTALSGLIAEQTALDTTGNNIANANTEGYSRETALLEPNPPLLDPRDLGPDGPGRTARHRRQRRDDHADPQRLPGRPVPHAEQRPERRERRGSEVLEQAQSAFNEPSTAGIASQLSNFWSAWNSLADSPTSEAAKEAVVAAGKQLATTFNELSAQLSTISSQAGEQYNALTGPVGRSRRLRQADRAAQRPDQALRRSRPAAQQHARPSRPAARQALLAGQHHRQRTARPHGHGELRRSRPNRWSKARPSTGRRN